MTTPKKLDSELQNLLIKCNLPLNDTKENLELALRKCVQNRSFIDARFLIKNYSYAFPLSLRLELNSTFSYQAPPKPNFILQETTNPLLHYIINYKLKGGKPFTILEKFKELIRTIKNSPKKSSKLLTQILESSFRINDEFTYNNQTNTLLGHIIQHGLPFPHITTTLMQLLNKQDIKVNLYLYDKQLGYVPLLHYLVLFIQHKSVTTGLITSIVDKYTATDLNSLTGAYHKIHFLTLLYTNLNNEVAKDKIEEVISYVCQKQGIDTNVQDLDGITPLHCAALCGAKPELIRLLITNNAKINAQDIMGQTPLHNIIISINQQGLNQKFLDTYNCLIENGALDEIKNYFNLSPKELLVAYNLVIKKEIDFQQQFETQLGLIFAPTCKYNFAELIQKGANPNKTISHVLGNTIDIHPLELVLGFLVNRLKYNLLDKNTDYCIEQIYQTVKTLLENGCDPNFNNSNQINQSLHLIASLGDKVFAIAELLLKYKANPHQFDENGRTPFMIAIAKGAKKIIESILQQKINQNELWKIYSKKEDDEGHKDIWYMIELHIANDGLLDIMKLLITKKLIHNPEIILHQVAINGYLEALRCIYEYLYNDNLTLPCSSSTYFDKIKILTRALFAHLLKIKQINYALVEFLLEKGADIYLPFNVNNTKKTTLLCVAIESRDPKLMKPMLTYGSKEMINTPFLQECIEIAISFYQPDLVKFWLDQRQLTNLKLNELFFLAVYQFVKQKSEENPDQNLIQQAKDVLNVLLNKGFKSPFAVNSFADEELNMLLWPESTKTDVVVASDSHIIWDPNSFQPPSKAISSRTYLKSIFSEEKFMRLFNGSVQAPTLTELEMTSPTQKKVTVSWFNGALTTKMDCIKDLGLHRFLYINRQALENSKIDITNLLNEMSNKDIKFGTQILKIHSFFKVNVLINNMHHEVKISHEYKDPSCTKRIYILQFKPNITSASDNRSTLYIPAIPDESGLHVLGDIKSLNSSIACKTIQITLPEPQLSSRNEFPKPTISF